MLDSIEQGLAHHSAGRLEEAAAIYQQILDVDPDHADALHLLGTLAFQQKRNAEAIELIGRALKLAPDAPEFHAAMGQVLAAEGELMDAVSAYQRSLELRDEQPDVHFNLACTFLTLGQPRPAIQSFTRAISLRQDFADAFNNLGAAFRAVGKLDEATDCYAHAVKLEPANAAAIVNLGQVLKSTGQLDAAIACFDRALVLRPDMSEARSGKIYTLHYHPAADSARLLWENVQWNQRHVRPLRGIRRAHANDRSPDRKLRIGYISPDFRDHIAGHYLLPLLFSHDRSQFEIHCYSNSVRADAMTEKFRSGCDGWRDISRLDDAGADELIRRDRIDILLDTTLHMGGNRLPLFARKPAPIQVTFCGYPGTAGVETIDYRLSDPYLDPLGYAQGKPPGQGDEIYLERTVRLPATFWCYSLAEDSPPVGPLPCEANGRITFGCLNNFCKVNDDVLALWAKVLREVPGSNLLLLTPAGQTRARVLEKLSAEGIDAARVEFVDHQPRVEYLRTHHRIDIALDTFPYNGHMTSLDAFWMGVPVVTLIGRTAVGRAGWSQLNNLNLPDLAAKDVGDYVKIAANLAGDIARLRELRGTLRSRMKESPLMDAASFTRGIEQAFRRIWREWCANQI